tara:strand:- start:561 stop:815 length:255 start_codon:yes stop_codon:yes gene_type:complete
MSETSQDPPVKLFLFSVPMLGIGDNSDSAFRYAVNEFAKSPHSVIRGEVTYDCIEDKIAYEVELDRAMAAVAKHVCLIDPDAES